MDEKIIAFLQRAELFMARVEASLPHGLLEPDWTESIAFRYRRRSSGQGVISAVHHVGAMNLADLVDIDQQKEKILLPRSDLTSSPVMHSVQKQSQVKTENAITFACARFITASRCRMET